VIDKLISLANSHVEFARSVHDGHMQDKEWMREHITTLTTQNRSSLRELVRPIGRSVRRIKIGDPAPGIEPVVIEEAEGHLSS
jgi:hypothetical protein